MTFKKEYYQHLHPHPLFYRSVMHFQYMSISRGGNSIIERLTRAGIDPSEYIDWYSLRNWGRIRPPKQQQQQEEQLTETDAEPTKLDEEDTTSSGIKLTDNNDADADNEIDTQDLAGGDDEEYDDPEQYVTELLYIHDKIMIVDDKIALIGSGNVQNMFVSHTMSLLMYLLCICS